MPEQIQRSFKCNSCHAIANGSDEQAVEMGWDIGAGNGDPQQFCQSCAAARQDAEAVHAESDDSTAQNRQFAVGDLVRLAAGGRPRVITAIKIGSAGSMQIEAACEDVDGSLSMCLLPMECFTLCEESVAP